MSLLRIENLSFEFADNPVLNKLTLEVAPGEFLGVLGPNGSGKTTLLRCLSRVLTPASGSVFLEGKNLQQYSCREIAQVIAVVPQEVETGFEFSVSEFVGMGRTPYLKPFRGYSQQDLSAVRQAMELTNTAALSDRGFRELSGGERQRVVIAQALAQQPRLLLLDEPAAYLDISQKIEIFNLIQELNRRHGITVLVVLHDLNLASRYCRSVLMLQNGRVFSRGCPEAVLTPENIRQVYHAEVEILRSKGKKYIIPLESIEKEVRG